MKPNTFRDLIPGLICALIIGVSGFLWGPVLKAPGRVDVLEAKVKNNYLMLKTIDHRTQKIYEILLENK